MDEPKLEREALREGMAWRMSLSLRLQHVFFMICVFVLALTGLALFFADSDISRWLIELQGGFENRGLIHRIAAVGLIISVAVHVLYSLFSAHGSREFRRRFLGREDFRRFADSVRYSIGRRKQPPAGGKYAFGQKVHYWLSGFFAVTMIVSGLMLWDPTTTISFVPQWVVPVLLALHGYEGLLLVIVAVIWHLYDVHLSPRNFPMSSVWLSGKMPLDKAKEHHRLEYERLTGEQGEGDE
ncbi:MAG TPA: cytochrome b/b6 domain-containing protein [Acidobacteriota bacterium]|nr:cytochrome b/b6 domain-containing protein [Acidobacteriota bacterium]